MPSRSNSIKIAVSFLFLTLIIATTIFWPHKSPNEKPALMLSSFLSKGVSNRTLKVNIEFDAVKTDEEVTTITAHISMPFNFSQNIKFRWLLGDGVKLIDGATDGDVLGLNANEEKSLQIKVRGFSKQQNHQVKFEAIGAVAGQYVIGESMVASDLEHTFENTVQNVERIKASQ